MSRRVQPDRCSGRTAVVNWARRAGVAPPPRKKAVYLDRKMELSSRGWKPTSPPRPASPPPSPAGAGGSARKGRSPHDRLDIAARAPEPREAPRSSRAAARSWSCATPSSRGRSTYEKALPVRPDGGGGRRWLTGSGGASGCGGAGGALPRSTVLRPPGGGLTRPTRTPPCGPTWAAFEGSGAQRLPPRPRRARAGAGAPQRPAARGSTRRGRWRSPRRWCAGSWPRRAARPRLAGGPTSSYAGEDAQPAAGRRRPRPATSRPPPPARPGHRHHRVQAARRRSPAVDLFERRRRLLGGHLAVQALVVEMLAGAAAAGRFTLHSDRGWHRMTGCACGEAGVERSMSRKGHSPDNAACEGSSAGSRSSSSTEGLARGLRRAVRRPSSPRWIPGTGRGG